MTQNDSGESNVRARRQWGFLANCLLLCATTLCCAQGSTSGNAAPGSPGLIKSAEGAVDVLNPVPEPEVPFLESDYVPQVVRKTKQNWYSMIPRKARAPRLERGKVLIEFEVQPDGKVTDMTLIGPSGDTALDRAAWEAIRKSQPYAPFGKSLTVTYLKLRFTFLYNEKPESQKVAETKPQ